MNKYAEILPHTNPPLVLIAILAGTIGVIEIADSFSTGNSQSQYSSSQQASLAESVKQSPGEANEQCPRASPPTKIYAGQEKLARYIEPEKPDVLITNLSWKICKITQKGVVAASGYCIKEKDCRANVCAGKQCKLPNTTMKEGTLPDAPSADDTLKKLQDEAKAIEEKIANTKAAVEQINIECKNDCVLPRNIEELYYRLNAQIESDKAAQASVRDQIDALGAEPLTAPERPNEQYVSKTGWENSSGLTPDTKPAPFDPSRDPEDYTGVPTTFTPGKDTQNHSNAFDAQEVHSRINRPDERAATWTDDTDADLTAGGDVSLFPSDPATVAAMLNAEVASDLARVGDLRDKIEAIDDHWSRFATRPELAGGSFGYTFPDLVEDRVHKRYLQQQIDEANRRMELLGSAAKYLEEGGKYANEVANRLNGPFDDTTGPLLRALEKDSKGNAYASKRIGEFVGALPPSPEVTAFLNAWGSENTRLNAADEYLRGTKLGTLFADGLTSPLATPILGGTTLEKEKILYRSPAFTTGLHMLDYGITAANIVPLGGPFVTTVFGVGKAIILGTVAVVKTVGSVIGSYFR